MKLRLRLWYAMYRFFDDKWYRILAWAWYRYTTIKSRHLPHRWVDRDGVMAYTMFEILSQFVEKECDPGDRCWEGDGTQVSVPEPGNKIAIRHYRKEMQLLYDWWHNDYNGRYKKIREKCWDAYSVHYEKNTKKDFCQIRNVYVDEEAGSRGRELMRRWSESENFAETALERRLPRLLAIRKHMWT